jgi:hypothetical protein
MYAVMVGLLRCFEIISVIRRLITARAFFISLILFHSTGTLNAQLILTNAVPSASVDFSNNMQTTVGSNPSQPFSGAGFSPNPVIAGRLNSNAWSFTGWSDGNLNFGATNISGDYARGTSTTAQTTGGVYAYTGVPGSAANPSMMFQPGGSDFDPGTVTLRLQNNGTTIISQLALSYDLFVRNDQARSNSFNFSWSTDNNTYTDVVGLDYASIAASDALGWVQVGTSPSRLTNITGITFTPGSSFYLRWTSTSTGAGSRDEVGIDNIAVVATYDAPCSQPATQATITSFANTTPYQTDLTFTRGNGTGGVLIVASTSSSLSANPVSGNIYGTNTNFGNGDPVGGGFVVFRGAANGAGNAATITVTGLSPSTNFYFFAFEYNITVPCFKTPGNFGSVLTAAGSATSSTDFFRSRISGNWNNSLTWESSPNNITWNTATAKPTQLSSGITVRTGHTVTITAGETARLFTIQSGGILTYANQAAGGYDFDIASDGTATDDFIIFGTYEIYGIAPGLASGATCRVKTNGLVKANGNAGTNTSDDFARSLQIYLETNAIYEWNTINTFPSTGLTYFPNALASEYAIFRVSQTTAFPIGGGSPTTFNGKFQANASLSFQNGGVKIFRNGILGTGNINQLAGAGQFQITGIAELGGSGSITLNGGGILISSSSSTTLVSNKTVDLGTLTTDGILFTGSTTSYTISGTATFSLSAAASLHIGSASGITTAPTASGNIQTNVRTFNTGANYYYYGAVSQVTGNALPPTLTAILEINNNGIVGNNTVTLTNNNTTVSTFNLRRGLFAAGTAQQLNIATGGTVNSLAPGGSQSPALTAGIISFVTTGTIVPGTALGLTNVNLNGGVNMGGGNTTINGTLNIRTNGFVTTGTAPTYSSSPASTLLYSCLCNYGVGEEWYQNTFGTSAGVPNNVSLGAGTSINFGSSGFTREMRGDLTISSTSTFALSTNFGGDLNIKGNWIRASGGTFTPNARSVRFNGTSGNQTITVTSGGTETFAYLLIQKAAGQAVVQAAAPNATTVTVNGSGGGNTLQLISGDLDLNGQIFNFTSYFNGNQNNLGIDGTAGNLIRNIISTSGTGTFSVFHNDPSTRTMTIGRLSGNASLLVFGNGVRVLNGASSAGVGIDFGNTLTTINGTLQLNNFGFVTGFAPTYGANSFLIYNSGGLFERNVEWGSTSGPGYPFNVTVQNNSFLRLNFPNPNGNANRAIAGSLLISSGSTILLSTTNNSTLSVGRDITINGVLSLPTIIGGDLFVGRNWNRGFSGIFDHNNRAVFMNGSDNATITANNSGQYFPYLYLTKSALSNTVSLLDDINIGKQMGITTGTLQLSNKDVTLLSNDTTQASFGKVGAAGDVVYNSTGRFVVERYIPTGTLGGQHTKSWQLLAVPTNGTQTINAAWQEGATFANQNLVPGYGTMITSNITPLAPLFDALTNPASSASMRTYNPAGAGTWTNIPNTTSTLLYNAKGYMIFVRGDRSVTNFSGPGSSPTPTNLRSRGRLFVPGSNPPNSTTVLAGKFESIGNPYASAIDFLNITKPAAPAVDDVFYVWDPLLYGAFGFGGYQTISASNGYIPSPGGTANYSNASAYTKIQSGQAFLVHSTSGGGTVSFTENAKVDASVMVFRPPAVSINRQFLRTTLYAGANHQLADATVIAFDNQFSKVYEHHDAVKMMNTAENIGIDLEGRILAIDARKPVMRGDTVYFNITNLRQQPYQLRFGPQNLPATGLSITLVDCFLGIRSPISCSDSTYVNFIADVNEASRNPARFYLVFQRTSPLFYPLTENKIGVQHFLGSANQAIDIFPNPIENGRIRVHMGTKLAGDFHAILYESNGRVLKNYVFKGRTEVFVQELGVTGVVSGNYLLKIIMPSGISWSKKLFIP